MGWLYLWLLVVQSIHREQQYHCHMHCMFVDTGLLWMTPWSLSVSRPVLGSILSQQCPAASHTLAQHLSCLLSPAADWDICQALTSATEPGRTWGRENRVESSWDSSGHTSWTSPWRLCRSTLDHCKVRTKNFLCVASHCLTVSLVRQFELLTTKWDSETQRETWDRIFCLSTLIFKIYSLDWVTVWEASWLCMSWTEGSTHHLLEEWGLPGTTDCHAPILRHVPWNTIDNLL